MRSQLYLLSLISAFLATVTQARRDGAGTGFKNSSLLAPALCCFPQEDTSRAQTG